MNLKLFCCMHERYGFLSMLLLIIFRASLVEGEVPQFFHPNSTTEFNVFVGGTVKMDCRVPDTHTRPTVLWYKYGHPLEDVTYRTIKIKLDPMTWVLDLSNILLADARTYRCRVGYHGNTSKILERNFSLYVQELHENRPIILGAPSVNLTAEVGSKVKFLCHANSTSVPYIVWRKTKLHQLLVANITKSKNSSNDFAFETQSEIIEPAMISDETASRMRAYKGELVIPRVCTESEAKYTCLVFNQHGRVAKDFYLKVLPERNPSLQELQSIYGQRFERAMPLPLAVVVCVPLVLMVLVVAVMLRALERAKQQRYVNLENQRLESTGTNSTLASTNMASPACTCAKRKHLEVSSLQTKPPRTFKLVDGAHQSILPGDTPLQLSRPDKPSTPPPFNQFPDRPVLTAEKDSNIIPCKGFWELSLEEEPLLNLEARVNEPVPHLQEVSLSQSDQFSNVSDLELEWEGIDLTITNELRETVQLSKEEDV